MKLLIPILFFISVQAFGQTAQDYLTKARSKTRANDFQAAIDDYSKAIALDKELDDAYYERALVKRELGLFDEALADFDKALGLDEFFLVANMQKATVYIELKKYELALQELNRIIKVNEKYPKVLELRASVHLKLDNRAAACQDLQRRVELGIPMAVRELERYCNTNIRETFELDWTQKNDWELVDSYVIDTNLVRNPSFIQGTTQVLQVSEYVKKDKSTASRVEDLSILAVDYDDVYPIDKTRITILETYRQACPNLKTSHTTTEDGPYPYTVFHIDCEELQGKKVSASQVWYIIRGKKKIFMTVLTIKNGLLTISERNNWITFFRNGKIVLVEE